MSNFKKVHVKHFLLVFFFSFCISKNIFGQIKVDPNNKVGIGIETPHSSAKLDVHSETLGFLKPRLTTTNRNAIVAPAAGLEVYDINENRTYWYNGTTWVTYGSGSGTGGTLVTAGTGIIVDGDGTSGNPYKVSSTIQPNSTTLNGLISLLSNDETASSEFNNSTSESSDLKSYTLAPNSYSKILIEAIVRSKVDLSSNIKPSFSWKFKKDNVQIRNPYAERILSTTSTTGGGWYTNTLSVICDGGQTQNTVLSITAQMSQASTSIGCTVEAFRIYSISNTTIEGVVGPEGPQGPQGPQGQGGLTVAGNNILVTGSGILGDEYIITNTFTEADASTTNELQTISTNNTPGQISLSNGGGNLMLNVNDDDSDPGNEMQTLSISGNDLTISGRNTVTLPSGSSDPTNLTITGSNSPVTLNSSTGTDVTFTAGNGISLTGTTSNVTITNTFEEGDASTTNEIQTLSTDGTPGNLSMSKGGGTVTLNVKDDDFVIGNEFQDLSLSGTTLTISNGNSVNLSPTLVTGSGTNNYIAKWTPNGNTLGNSQIFENGTSVGIGTTSASGTAKLHVVGRVLFDFPTTNYGNTSIAIGHGAGNDNQTGTNNIFMGLNSGFSTGSGYNNVFIGGHSGYNTTEGNNNIFMGANSGGSNVSGSSNVVLGHAAASGFALASDNVIIGHEAAVRANGTSQNTYVGYRAGYELKGARNSCFGYKAGGREDNNNGSENSFFGYNAGDGNKDGSNNTCIGSNSTTGSTNLTNATAIGNLCAVDAADKVWIGNASVTVIGGAADWSKASDIKFKSEIQENVPGLSFVTKLKPVTYKFDTKKFQENLIRNLPDSVKSRYLENVDFKPTSNIIRTGFVANDVDRICNEIGYKFDGVTAPADKEGHYLLAYSQFVVPLVKAVQEQQLEIENLEKKINDQKAILDTQKTILDEKDKILQDLIRRIVILEHK